MRDLDGLERVSIGVWLCSDREREVNTLVDKAIKEKLKKTEEEYGCFPEYRPIRMTMRSVLWLR